MLRTGLPLSIRAMMLDILRVLIAVAVLAGTVLGSFFLFGP